MHIQGPNVKHSPDLFIVCCQIKKAKNRIAYKTVELLNENTCSYPELMYVHKQNYI